MLLVGTALPADRFSARADPRAGARPAKTGLYAVEVAKEEHAFLAQLSRF
jgi:hypothetical protein